MNHLWPRNETWLQMRRLPRKRTCDSRPKRALTGDVLAPVGDVDVVEAGGEGHVLHAAAAVFVVLARHLGLRRTLDGDAQTADTSPPGGDTQNQDGCRAVFQKSISILDDFDDFNVLC